MTSADDDDASAMWRAVRQAGQEKRADNRDSSAQMLREAGVAFESKNGGAHLIVRGNGAVVDFWPGTGLWKVRGSTQQRRGIRKLLAWCRVDREGEQK